MATKKAVTPRLSEVDMVKARARRKPAPAPEPEPAPKPRRPRTPRPPAQIMPSPAVVELQSDIVKLIQYRTQLISNINQATAAASEASARLTACEGQLHAFERDIEFRMGILDRMQGREHPAASIPPPLRYYEVAPKSADLSQPIWTPPVAPLIKPPAYTQQPPPAQAPEAYMPFQPQVPAGVGSVPGGPQVVASQPAYPYGAPPPQVPQYRGDPYDNPDPQVDLASRDYMNLS